MRVKFKNLKMVRWGSTYLEVQNGVFDYHFISIESTEINFPDTIIPCQYCDAREGYFYLDFNVDLSHASVKKHEIKIIFKRLFPSCDQVTEFEDVIEYSGKGVEGNKTHQIYILITRDINSPLFDTANPFDHLF